jgi:acetyl-CoA carboxylase carboxyl transferase subunit alpha
MKMTSADVKALGCVDDIVEEPAGGAHNDPVSAAQLLDAKLELHLNALRSMPLAEMMEQRRAKFRNIAQFYTI